MEKQQRFYIARPLKIESDYRFADVVSVYYYLKDDGLAAYVDREGKPTKYLIFSENGEDTIINDCHGAPLQEIDIKALLDYFKSCPDDYRRRAPFVALLRAFQKEIDKGNFDRLVILRYYL